MVAILKKVRYEKTKIATILVANKQRHESLNQRLPLLFLRPHASSFFTGMGHWHSAQ